MDSSWIRIAVLSLVVMVVAQGAQGAEDAGLPPAGSQVEVREGDSWSAATFVRKEGRRLLVRYEDGTEEWIAADRMRASSAGGAPGLSPQDGAAADVGIAEASGAAEGGAGGAAQSGITPVPLEAMPVEIKVDRAPIVRRTAKAMPRPQPASRPTPEFIKMSPASAVTLSLVRQFVLCPDTPDIVLAVADKPFADETQILRIDLSAPEQFECRSVDLRKHEILGAAEGGQVLLTTARRGTSTIMHVWKYDGGEYQPCGNYALASERGGERIQWATLLTPTRVVVGSDNENCYLVDLKIRRAVGVQKVGGQSRTLSSSGQLLAFVPSPGTGRVMRLSDLAVVAEFPAASPHYNISIDPTGTFAAYVTLSNTIRVVRLATGAKVNEIAGAVRGSEQIDLLSGEWLLVGRRMLYEVKRGIPIREYATPPRTQGLVLPSGQMLFALFSHDSTELALASLPDAKALAAAKAVAPDQFLLAPGAPVQITGNLGIYGKGEAQARETIGRALVAAGHRVVKDAKGYELNVSSVAGPAPMVDYRGGHRIRTPSTIVTVCLKRQGATLWQQTFKSQAQVMVLVQPNQTLEQAIADAGKPQLLHLNMLAIPAYIAKGSTPDRPGALGACTVTADGFGPAPERKEAPGESPAPARPGAPDLPRRDAGKKV